MENTKILIVEDNITFEGKPLEKFLKENGYEIIGLVDNIADATKIAESESPDLIIMDISLHGDRTAGITAAKEIQSIIDTHVIYLTGIDLNDEELSDIKKTKSYDFERKPVNELQLLTKIKLAPFKKKSNEIFICYSHQDAEFAIDMQKFLNPLSEVGIDYWVDTKIGYGAKWKDEIQFALERAKAAILLISIDFINSKFITEIELPYLLKAEEERGMKIIPVFIRSVPETILKQKGILNFQGLNSPSDPLDNWKRADRERLGWGKLFDFIYKELRL